MSTPGQIIYTPSMIYKLDDKDLYNIYGIVIKGTRGIMETPKLKEPMKTSPDDGHGIQVDLSKVYYDFREITLEGWMLASTREELNTTLQSFFLQLTKSGYHRLYIETSSAKPLLFQVYAKEGLKITDKGMVDGKNYAEFTISLVEPEPYKRVYKITTTPNQVVSLSITTSKPINIFWGVPGDGSWSLDCSTGSWQTTYNSAGGVKYIVMTGDIDSISSVVTSATLVWDKLL